MSDNNIVVAVYDADKSAEEAAKEPAQTNTYPLQHAERAEREPVLVAK